MIEARVVDFHHSMTVDDSHDPFLLTVSVFRLFLPEVTQRHADTDTTSCLHFLGPRMTRSLVLYKFSFPKNSSREIPHRQCGVMIAMITRARG